MSPSAFPSLADDRLEPLAAICRRICLLRARGQEVAALSLERTELSTALDAFTYQHGGSLPPETLAALFQRERERVADAFLLADILAERWPASAALPASPTAAAAPAPVPATAIARPSPAPAGPRGAPGIADLIDGMLAQDRSPPNSRASAA